jgi:DNA-binding transcriptional ArsR family regulator
VNATLDRAAVALTAAEARRLTARIRDALALADDLLARAYAGRAWAALGHASWEAYCAAELPELRHIKLRRPERRARIQTLRDAAPGISVRELAAATGASVGTVHGDLAPPAGSIEPAGGTGTVARVLAVLAVGPADVFTIARRTRLRQAQVSPALSRLAAAGRIAYTPPARRGGTGTYATVTR